MSYQVANPNNPRHSLDFREHKIPIVELKNVFAFLYPDEKKTTFRDPRAEFQVAPICRICLVQGENVFFKDAMLIQP